MSTSTEHRDIYFEVYAGTSTNESAILTWGWSTHAAANHVAQQLLGKTLAEAFTLLGADGGEPYTLHDLDLLGQPCVSADWEDPEDNDRITIVSVSKRLASTDTLPDEEAFRTTTRCKVLV